MICGNKRVSDQNPNKQRAQIEAYLLLPCDGPPVSLPFSGPKYRMYSCHKINQVKSEAQSLAKHEWHTSSVTPNRCRMRQKTDDAYTLSTKLRKHERSTVSN